MIWAAFNHLRSPSVHQLKDPLYYNNTNVTACAVYHNAHTLTAISQEYEIDQDAKDDKLIS